VITLLTILYVLVCFFLIMVVLLQQGKGADLSGAFGGGGTQTAFGPRTGATLMHKLTTASFVLFILLSMALAILQGRSQRSVMEGVKAAKPTPAASAPKTPQPLKKPAPAAAQTAPEPGQTGGGTGQPSK